MDASPEDQLLTELVDEVFRLAGRFSRAGDDLAAPAQLTAARWLVLGALQDGAATMAQVARRRGLRRQSVRESADRLERTGLLIRAPNLVDRRAPLLLLTEEGRQALATLEPRRRAWAERLAGSTDVASLDAALATLRALGGALAVPEEECQR